MTKIDLDEIKALLAGSAQGQWVFDTYGTISAGLMAIFKRDAHGTKEDALAIVALHNAAPAMIAEIQSLRTQLAQAKADGDAMAEVLGRALSVLENSGAESGYCMCGDPVAGHLIGSDHSPVDSHMYMAGQLSEDIRAALAKRDATDQAASKKGIDDA